MMERNHGHIITMLGSTAVCGLGNFSDICSAKFGLVGLMESVDHELTLGNTNISFSLNYIQCLSALQEVTMESILHRLCRITLRHICFN